MPQIIKVCGMREAQNISSVVYSGANMIGLNFIPNSLAMLPNCLLMQELFPMLAVSIIGKRLTWHSY